MTTEAELPDDQTMRLPVVQEALSVDKRTVETGRVRVTSRVSSEDVVVREHLTSTTVRVERVPIDRLVDVVPPPRTEGARTVLSVTEEVLVRRIRVIEEIHLISEDHTDLHEETVTLRRLDVQVERLGMAERDQVSLATNPSPEGEKT